MVPILARHYGSAVWKQRQSHGLIDVRGGEVARAYEIGTARRRIKRCASLTVDSDRLGPLSYLMTHHF